VSALRRDGIGAVTLYAQLRVNIAASDGRDGKLSSLEGDVGGLTAIVAAPANSAAATAIFKHVDIEVTASVNLFPALM